MTEIPEMPPEVPVVQARRSLWDRISVIWLVPIAALIIALAIAWQSFANQGPVIEITFADASGIAPGETQLRFRDVGVGLVEELQFTPEFDQVIVRVRLQNAVADYVDDDATFWVVRPQVTTQGISGLETVLSGVYIKGQWDTDAGGLRRQFEGLAEAPLLSADEQGTTILLSSAGGGLRSNVPILYKGVEVGRVGPARVTVDGFAVEAEAVVLSPWDALLTEATRFYNASGFSLTLGGQGASLDFESAASLLVGGVSFETWVSGAPLARPGATFLLYGDVDQARSSVFNRLDGPPLYLSAVFEGNVAGLSIGAPVEIDGLRIGEVTGMTGVVDRAAFGDGAVRLLAQLSIQPARLGLDGEEPELALALLQDQVAQGLRARLVTGNLLSGALKVQLTRSDLPPGRINLDAVPYPSLPVAPSDISDIQANAQGTLDRLNALPIEEMLDSANIFLQEAARLAASEDLQATPGDIRRVLAQIEAVTAAAEVQAMPARVDAVLVELEETLAAARLLVDALNDGGAADRVLAAVDSTGAAMEEARTAIAGLPDLVENLDALVVEARALGLQSVVAGAEGLLADARALVGGEAVQALPGQAADTLAGIDGLVSGIEDSGIIANADAAVTDLRSTLAEISAATADLPALVAQAEAVLANVDTAAAGLPGLIENLDGLVLEARALGLAAIATEAEGLLADARALVGGAEVQALPGQAADTLAGIDGLVSGIEDSGIIANADAAVTDLRGALAEISAATADLPALVEQAEAVLANVDTAAEGLPDLIAHADRIAGNLAEADAAGVIDRAGALVEELTAWISTEDMQALPGGVNDLVAEATAIATDLREAGVAESLDSSLAAVETAAAQMAEATASLPDLTRRASATLDSAETALSGLSDLGQVMRDANTALREISRAAQAVGSLAQRLERNPNALIFGRN